MIFGQSRMQSSQYSASSHMPNVGLDETKPNLGLATKKDINDVSLRLANLAGEVALVKWMLAAVLGIAVTNFAKQFF